MSTSCNCAPVYPAPPPPPHHPQGSPHITSCVKPVVGGFTDELKDKLEGIEENANNYVLPVADDDTLGGIMIGEGLVADENGTVSVDVDSLIETIPIGDTLLVTDEGELSVNTSQFITVADFEGVFILDGGGAGS